MIYKELLLILSFAIAEMTAVDCTPGSINGQNLTDLLKRYSDKQCRNEVRKQFEKNFKNQLFKFDCLPDVTLQEAIGSSVQNVVSVRDCIQVVRVLMYFGDLMQNIEIQFIDMSEVQGRMVLKSVNEHSHESLRRLNLMDCKGKMLNVLKQIFSEVRILKISTYEGRPLEIDDEMTFNEFFPRITHLEIGRIFEPDWIILNATFSHLKWVKIFTPDIKFREFYELRLMDFFRLNKQIDGLAIISPIHEVLEVAQQTLIYLDTLELIFLYNLKCGEHEINFNTVKKLNIESAKYDHAVNLNVHQESIDNWIRILQNNVNSKLNLFTFTVQYLAKDQLFLISEIFPYLESFKLKCKSSLAAADIAKFIENSSHLKHIELHVEIDTSNENNLQKILTKNWILELNTNSTLANVKGSVISRINQGDNETEIKATTNGRSSTLITLTISLFIVSNIVAGFLQIIID